MDAEMERNLRKIAEAVDEKLAHIVALSAIIASLPETAKLDGQSVKALAQTMMPMGFGTASLSGKAGNLVSQILHQAAEVEKSLQQ